MKSCKKQIKVTITPRVGVDIATQLYSIMESKNISLSALVDSLLRTALKGVK